MAGIPTTASPSPLWHYSHRSSFTNIPVARSFAALVNWCNATLGGADEAITDSAGLETQWPSATPGKMSKGDGVAMSTLLESQGYGIEPDVRFSGPQHTRTMVIFRLGEQHGGSEDARVSLEKAGPVLQLAGMVIASTHGSHSTLNGVTTELVRDLSLARSDSARVRAHLRWATSLPSLPPVAKRLFAKMDPASAKKVGQFLIDLTARHSELGPSQVSALTAAFSVLGLAPAGVYSLIHERTTHAAGDLVTVRSEGELVQGEPIPPPPVPESDKARKCPPMWCWIRQ